MLEGGPLRLWKAGRHNLTHWQGTPADWTLPLPDGAGDVVTPAGSARLIPLPGNENLWLEPGGNCNGERARQIGTLVSRMVESEDRSIRLAEELAGRYEEIDLLYAISEILGRTLRLDEAAQIIVGEVSTVAEARRASIMVYDERNGLLRTVAARGFSPSETEPVETEDQGSVAAAVWRDKRVVLYDPTNPDAGPRGPHPERGYRGEAFLSVPICYASPGTYTHCIGVINLTDRLGGGAFTDNDVKLLSAIANQIGAAIENARLVARDLRQQRLRRELELAHDLQLRLMPSPSVLQGVAEIAARTAPLESVGGDFYTFSRLGQGRVGVMLGDVSSHGFSAALIMALTLSAAAIHAASSLTPDETLMALADSLDDDLTSTEMHLSLFYGVLDPDNRQLLYSNAGHPYAFRIPRTGPPERLATTSPPLGLTPINAIKRETVTWDGSTDLLCLWTDGLADARNSGGEPFGEDRLLEVICRHRLDTPQTIVDAVFKESDSFTNRPADDRTMLVLRI